MLYKSMLDIIVALYFQLFYKLEKKVESVYIKCPSVELDQFRKKLNQKLAYQVLIYYFCDTLCKPLALHNI